MSSMVKLLELLVELYSPSNVAGRLRFMVMYPSGNRYGWMKSILLNDEIVQGLTGTLELIAVTGCSPIKRSKLIVSAKFL
jgi:hypothetical protein